MVAMDTTDKLVAYLSCGISGVTVKVYVRSTPAAAKQSPGEGGAEWVWRGREWGIKLLLFDALLHGSL